MAEQGLSWLLNILIVFKFSVLFLRLILGLSVPWSLRPSEKRCDFCSGMVASPLAASVVIAILRCDFCADKFRGR